MPVTTNILQRTFQIRLGESIGTCFTIDIDGRQYIVTAKHVVDSITDSAEILRDGTYKEIPISVIGHGNGDIDISVLATDFRLSPTHPLPASSKGIVLAQDVYFLGFPYGLANSIENIQTINRAFPLPLVKKGIVSAFSDENGTTKFLLDAHNNPGFSGGPVVFSRPEDSYTGELKVAAVISGYHSKSEPVYQNNMPTPLTYEYNTGIVIATGIRHAVDLIRDNPVGYKL